MPDLPINSVLPSTEAQVKAYKSWFQLLGGGGLALLMACIGIVTAYNMFTVVMEDRDEDRQELREADKEFREQMLKATVDHTVVTSKQTLVQEQTNEALEEVTEALTSMGERIEGLAENEAKTAERLDRMIEKAWNVARPAPQPPVDQPK